MADRDDRLGAIRARRRVGVRLWLMLAFAGVGVITALSVYLFISDRTTEAISDREAEVATARTERLGTRLGIGFPETTRSRIQEADGESYAAWAFGPNGALLTPPIAGLDRDVEEPGVPLSGVGARDRAVRTALNGDTFEQNLPGGVTIAAAPITVQVPSEGTSGEQRRAWSAPSWPVPRARCRSSAPSTRCAATALQPS